MRQRKVVSKKLFSKIRKLSYELLEMHPNENFKRKILRVDGFFVWVRFWGDAGWFER